MRKKKQRKTTHLRKILIVFHSRTFLFKIDNIEKKNKLDSYVSNNQPTARTLFFIIFIGII